jgi:hypothetical protein
MTFKERLHNVAAALLPNNKIFAEYYKRSGGGSKAEWTRQVNTLQAKEIKDWKNGVMAATNPDDPRRGDLMRFYENMNTDLHLQCCIDNRILPVQCAPFKLVNKNNEENIEAKKLLERPWYLKLVRLINIHVFEGTKLLEIFELNENAELKEITEIPQSNFIPQKGIIIKEEYDSNGVSYREGAYRDYYVQIGGDWNLGIYSQLAIIVLAKKLGIGSWLSYIDKFGVPAIFAITNRLDTGRRNELFEMLENFRQNHFAVLQGDEKIETPQGNGVDAHHTFKSLIVDVCNQEISKRILGGTGTTDEKSFVGSVEVHEKLLTYRNAVDKLIFKFYFNQEIKPRLVKISPVYAILKDLNFEWDETENLTIKELLEAIKGLSAYYEFDINELAKITGLPITKIKNAIGITDQTQQEPAGTQKKKPDAVAITSPTATATTEPPMAATWDAAVEQLVNKIWNGDVNAAELNRDLVLKYYAGLNKATQGGWGGGYYTNDLTRQFRENLLKFSGAKSYNLIDAIIAAKGSETSKDAYLSKAKALVNTHNETWQQVEEKFAANSASSARDFQAYQKDADLYPNLKYRTMGDAEVRPEHAENEGVIKPINEWTKIPPLSYGCRCWLEQTMEAPNGRNIEVYDDKIANNAAINGTLFTPKNGYFQKIPATQKQTINANTDLMKEFMPYNRTIKAGEKTVFVNDFADLSDLQPNIDAAKQVAELLNKDVYIRPHVDAVQGHKNPELGIGTRNNFADLKTMKKSSKNFFNNRLRAADKQGCEYVVANIDTYNGTQGDLNSMIRSGFLWDGKNISENVQQVILLKGNNAAKITRKQVLKGDYGSLDKLMK